MRLLLTYLYRHIFEKKGRSLLLILSIAVSGALIYASLGVKDCLKDMYYEKLTFSVGKADVIISSDKASGIKMDNKDNTIGSYYNLVNGNGVLESLNKNKLIFLTGITIHDFEHLYDVIYSEPENGLNVFKDNSVIISEHTADKYGYKLNDIIKVNVYNDEKELKVVAIMKDIGPFLDDSINTRLIVPFKTLSDWMYLSSKANNIYIDLDKNVDIDDAINKLGKQYTDYNVQKAVNMKSIEDDISVINTSMIASAVLASIMCIVIIYLSFNIILTEQLPQIGTFRSVGANQGKMKIILYIESGFYGAIGAIVGIAMGVGVTYIITLLSTPDNLKGIVDVPIRLNPLYMMISAVVAIVISLLGVYIPIRKISKIPIKNIVLNLIGIQDNGNMVKKVIYIIPLIISIILPKIADKKMLIPAIIISFLCAFISIAQLVTIALFIVSKIWKYILKLFVGNIEKIINSNVVSYQKIKSSTTLVMIGVSILLILAVLMNSLNVIIIRAAEDSEIYDIAISYNNVEQDTIDNLNDISCVLDYFSNMELRNVNISGKDRSLTHVDCISHKSYMKYRNIPVDDVGILDKLNEGDYVILSSTMAERMELAVGDTITLDVNNKEVKYEIIDLIDTYIYSGSFAVVGIKSIFEPSENPHYNNVMIHIDDQTDLNVAVQMITSELKSDYMSMTTRDEFINGLATFMKQMTSIIKCFSFLAIAVGVIGVFNNFFLNYEERKRIIAIFRSIGMSKNQLTSMLIGETVIIGTTGGVMGIICSRILLHIIPMVMNIANVDMPLILSWKLQVLYLIGAIVVTVLATILLKGKLFKQDIVSLIKVE